MPEDIAFSRNGNSDAAKRTSRIEIPCTEDFRDKVAGLAAMYGLSVAEYSRNVLERTVLGDLHIARRVIPMCPLRTPEESA